MKPNILLLLIKGGKDLEAMGGLWLRKLRKSCFFVDVEGQADDGTKVVTFFSCWVFFSSESLSTKPKFILVKGDYGAPGDKRGHSITAVPGRGPPHCLGLERGGSSERGEAEPQWLHLPGGSRRHFVEEDSRHFCFRLCCGHCGNLGFSWHISSSLFKRFFLCFLIRPWPAFFIF